MITAFSTFFLSRHSATRLSSFNISALTSSGLLPTAFRVAFATGSAPIHRFTLVTTRIGSTARRLSAFRPTSISPSFPNHTALGMILRPSSSASRIGKPDSTTPIAECVVPRSIPTIIS